MKSLDYFKTQRERMEIFKKCYFEGTSPLGGGSQIYFDRDLELKILVNNHEVTEESLMYLDVNTFYGILHVNILTKNMEEYHFDFSVFDAIKLNENGEITLDDKNGFVSDGKVNKAVLNIRK